MEQKTEEALSTGTYWYVLEWIEPDTNTKVNYKKLDYCKNKLIR